MENTKIQNNAIFGHEAKENIDSTMVDVVIDTSIPNSISDDRQVHQNINSPKSIQVSSTTSNVCQKENSVICRICHINDSLEHLITPCNCKGTLGFVHRNCLENWLSQAGLTQCELCNYEFRIRQSLRYTCCQSIKLWFKHPNNSGKLQADLIAWAIISFLTIVLACMCFYTLKYYVSYQESFGMPIVWMQVGIVSVLSFVVTVYLANCWVTLHANFWPWYKWWRNFKVVTVDL